MDNLMDTAFKVRRHIIEQVYTAQSGHIGGSLSCTDLLVALYFEIMNINPSEPDWEDRDRFVLSKGHCSPALYGVLAERGYFSSQELTSFRSFSGRLEGHPCMLRTPGVDMTTGSLGHGVSAAVGMSLDGRRRNKDYRVYVLTGDGEIQEGQIWEAVMSAAHYGLDNLCLVVDNNGLQIDGPLQEIMDVGDIPAKFKAFGWQTRVIAGHDFEEICTALKEPSQPGKPLAVIAKTVKGHGVTFMENSLKWHGTPPGKKERDAAVEELKRRRKNG